ncbi:MAG: hypothetical protein ICV83_35830, partial [Cytophagales bacterium]|nr:hypothetical protein [Cytophagales bacterium]
MQHIRQLQLALTILLTALVLLIVAGGALFYISSKPPEVVDNSQKPQGATDPQPQA